MASENAYVTPEASVQTDETAGPFFQVGTWKFILMDVATFGLYEFYWFYKNFRAWMS